MLDELRTEIKQIAGFGLQDEVVSNYIEKRKPQQVILEEDVRSLTSKEVSADNLPGLLVQVCTDGIAFWDSQIEDAQNHYPEKNGEQMSLLRENFVRAREHFTNDGNYPRQAAIVLRTIEEIAKIQSQEDFHQLSANRTFIDRDSNKVHVIKFRWGKDAEILKKAENQKRERDNKIDSLMTLAKAKYPETNDFLEKK